MRAALILAVCAVSAGAETTHTVVSGDHLWGLAGKYYNNHFRWRVIHAANSAKIKDPHWIYPGQVFVIPDVPGPEIGEIGARPVEASAAVSLPRETEPQDTPQAPPPVSPPERAKAAAFLEEPPGAPAPLDDLSEDMPPSFSGQYPSMIRLKVGRDWREDGAVTEFESREIMAAEGDSVHGRISARLPVAVGDRFMVYRRDAVEELDEDKKAVYLQKVAVLEVRKALGGAAYSFQILKSRDSVQVGDLLKKEGGS